MSAIHTAEAPEVANDRFSLRGTRLWAEAILTQDVVGRLSGPIVEEHVASPCQDHAGGVVDMELARGIPCHDKADADLKGDAQLLTPWPRSKGA